jgi:hypothetical protein
MKKLVLSIGAALMATGVFANETIVSKNDSCSYYQWKMSPVKGRCPEITNAVMIDGNLTCLVKCSYLEKEKARKERRKEDKSN